MQLRLKCIKLIIKIKSVKKKPQTTKTVSCFPVNRHHLKDITLISELLVGKVVTESLVAG